jgi:membrane protein DedA with SNARE-associated domain
MADLTPVFGLAALILVKEVGVPIPVPGDLIVLGTGVAAARGEIDGRIALATLIVASIAGGAIQFGLLRSVARPAMLRLLRRLGATDRIDRQTDRFARSGPGRIAVARMTPGVRIVTIAAGAIAGVPRGAFLIGLTAGNAVFIAAHFGLGFALGEPIVRFAGAALGPLAAVGIALAVVGLAGWLVIRRRRSSASSSTAMATVAAWADACCPACVTLGAVGLSAAQPAS